MDSVTEHDKRDVATAVTLVMSSTAGRRWVLATAGGPFLPAALGVGSVLTTLLFAGAQSEPGATARLGPSCARAGAAVVLGAARPPDSIWQLDGSPGSTALPTSAAAAAIARDVATYRGVDTATATLAGSRSAPTVHLDVAVETHASVADLRNRITAEALPRLRTALQMDQLPAQLVLRLDAHDGTRRVR